jgi:glycosyltransferase involved in cell wall biosynthesis
MSIVMEPSVIHHLEQVDILLSTYNGANYLEELLESLLSQTYEHWRLMIRDDGSNDNTLIIIHKYVLNYPGKIIYVNDGLSRMGAARSFGRLLELSTSNYIMFCDQDDVWLKNKIEMTLGALKELEEKHPNKPILIHTDLKVVDEKLKVISESFWEFQRLLPQKNQLENLIVQNNVTGCTVMINKRLKDLSVPLPQQIIMHDWWISLVASAFGEVSYINHATILYRQHSNNDTGAKRYSFYFFLKSFLLFKKSFHSIEKTINQTQEFYHRFEKRLNQNQAFVFDFSVILTKKRLRRLSYMMKSKLKKQGNLRNLGFMVLLFMFPSKQTRINNSRNI